MSDEGQITTGGGTAGLRDAAMAKRTAKQEAGAQAPASKAPQFVKGKPTPSADAVADGEARKAHAKLPTRAREEAANDNGEEEPDLSALVEPDAPANDNGETIKIGDFEIPVSVLEQLPDSALARIKRKIKAGGEELEVTLAEALAEVPKAKGWQKRMWEAAQKEKGIEGQAQQLGLIAKSMGTDAIGAIARLYGASRSQAADFISQQLISEIDREKREASMSPEERQRFSRMSELEQKEERLRALEEQEKTRAESESQAKHRQRYIDSMKPALEAAGLAVSKRNVRDVANMVATMMDDGLIKGDATPDDLRWAAAELAKEHAADEGESMPSDGEQLIARLGDQRSKAIAHAWAKRVQQRQQPAGRSASAAPRAKAPPQKAESFAEWQRRANADARKRDRQAGRR